MKTTSNICLVAIITTIGNLLMGSLLASSVSIKADVTSSPVYKYTYTKEKIYYIKSHSINVREFENCIFLEGKVTSKDEQIKIAHIIQKDFGEKRIYNKITY